MSNSPLVDPREGHTRKVLVLLAALAMPAWAEPAAPPDAGLDGGALPSTAPRDGAPDGAPHAAAPARTSAPPAAVVAPPEPDQIGVRPRRPRWLLVGAGVALFLLGYLGDIGATYGYHHEPGATSAIPLVGPFLQAGQRYGLDGPPVDSGDPAYDMKETKRLSDASALITSAAVASAVLAGVAQLAGATLAILGGVLPLRAHAHASPARVRLEPDVAGGRLTLTF
jgi:hypothetical protein